MLQPDLLLRGLHHRVGGQDRARGVFETILGEPGPDQLRQSIQDQMRVELDADHAGGGGKDLFRRHVQLFRDGIAARQRDTVAGSSCAIGIARVDQNRAYQPARFRQIESGRFCTGAACTRFCVNTAAAEAGVSGTISARSFCFTLRIPAYTAEYR